METVIVAIRICRCDRKDDIVRRRVSGQRNGEQRSANRGVVIPLTLDRRDNQVIRVIPASEENADQRFVIGDIGLGHRRVHEAEITDGGSERSRADSGAGSLAYELATA